MANDKLTPKWRALTVLTNTKPYRQRMGCSGCSRLCKIECALNDPDPELCIDDERFSQQYKEIGCGASN